MKVKDSKALLLEYLASIRDPERAASMFADDGAFELPFLRSLGIASRYIGRSWPRTVYQSHVMKRRSALYRR
jgi:uncharacterized protein